MGNGLASAAHLDHRRQRLIVQPAFRREHLRGYAAVMRQEITAAMARWHDGAHMDLVDEMFTLTTTIALRALFSSQLDPARWLTPTPEHRISYLPFGAGATKCIGEEFGLAEATLILATTAARWNLIPDPGTRVSPTARAVLVPRAFPVHLSSRSAP
jgi:cytochrome P450